MTLADYFHSILKDLKYQEWERKMHEQIDARVREVTAEQEDDTKWKCGFIEGMKYVLENPHNIVKARDTETPDAKG